MPRPPPCPVKVGQIDDVRRMQWLIFHVSCPPLSKVSESATEFSTEMSSMHCQLNNVVRNSIQLGHQAPPARYGLILLVDQFDSKVELCT